MQISKDRLNDMVSASTEISEVYRLLAKTESNIVGELLRGQGEFYEWDHYPNGDVYDKETHSQYYYHAHPAQLRANEHGHFHTFLRPKGMPSEISPVPVSDYTEPDGDNDALSHLIAISMDEFGNPVRLFTTNRWVTGEFWYDARDVQTMLDYFHIDQAYPSLVVNIWINAILRLFRPSIEDLLIKRDAAISDWSSNHHDTNVFEDRDLEITSYLDISLQQQLEDVHALSCA